MTARLVIVLGITASLLDSFTTWTALRSHRFGEATPATASLIRHLGLTGGVTARAAIACGAFLAAGFVTSRLPAHWRLGVVAVAAVGATAAWLIVLENITRLAA